MDQLELENAVMKMILNDPSEIFEGLKKQYEMATVISREFTGVGFFTEYNVPDYLAVNNLYGNINDVLGEFKDSDETIMFILFIRDGKIDTLEGVRSLYEWNYDYDKMNLVYAFDDKRKYDLD